VAAFNFCMALLKGWLAIASLMEQGRSQKSMPEYCYLKND
jgi:hypothetical protein